VLPMEPSAKRDAARSLIKRISREHNLDGAISGTKFGVLVTNCLEMYVWSLLFAVAFSKVALAVYQVSYTRNLRTSYWNSFKMLMIMRTTVQLQL